MASTVGHSTQPHTTPGEAPPSVPPPNENIDATLSGETSADNARSSEAPDVAGDLISASGIDPGDESARIDVIQADPNTPYHSANTFEELGLSDELMKGVYAMKFSKPSKIQATSLPLIISPSGEYKNLIAQAHNGSGKTACFVLAMLSRIDFSTQETQALCLVPTRELARQIESVTMKMGKFTSVKVKLAVKATSSERGVPRSEDLSSVNQHIIIGTPGKITDLLKKRQIVTSSIKILVLDEADEMVDSQGMGDQTIRIKRMLPKSVQVLLFSATYKDGVRALASSVAPGANHITVKRESLSLEKVEQYCFDTGSPDERYTVLSDIYDLLAVGQSIIFVRTRNTASELTSKLRTDGQTVSVLYGGDMAPEERDKVIDEFRRGTTRVLVTTNVLSRGVDISAVNTVINYDLPTMQNPSEADPETYLHRIGRTGRFGRKGVAINFVFDEKSKGVLRDLEKYYSKPIQKVDDVEALADRIKSL